MEYGFRSHQISSDERLWMTEVARLVKIDPKILKARLFGKVDSQFDPNSIDSRLYGNGQLTLIGLRLIDPENRVFDCINHVLIEIRKRILSAPGVERFEAQDISHVLGLEVSDVARAMREFSQLGNFYSSASGTDDGLGFGSISLNGDNAYDEYLRYTTIDDLLEKNKNFRAD